MFERFDAPEQVFTYRLGSALHMEQGSLKMLNELSAAAGDSGVKELLTQHIHETEHQVENLSRVFDLMNIDAEDNPSPTTKGLESEGESLVRKAEPPVIDDVVLAAALGAEHYEQAAYESLIITANALGRDDVAALLDENLSQERHAAEALRQKARELATR
ncbi:YciE/YciF ferroxidase family protein [Curtobacterium ammoniigenes]|uniref:YciE/YciF ferroxidase family protein n=1 Tax=Curtobacterium ammoniigenes TaxID=395387 RepID=UPI000A57446F|nr:DUF892 family protein [Curtobacterium ammoniigenes]